VKAACANSLWWLASGPSSVAFASALNDPDAAQERVLRVFLEKNSGTAFGREHGLPGVRTFSEFARHVPIRNYDEMQSWIDRITRGEQQVLTHDPVERLVPTSGSTVARKLIPYTASMHRELNRATGPWIFDLYRRHPRALRGVSYWAISPVSSDASQPADESSVAIGFDDDAAYLGTLRKRLIGATMAVPPLLRHIVSLEDWRYVSALLLLRRDDLSLVSIWHPFFFTLLLNVIRDSWEQLLSDIFEGQCAVMNCLPALVAAAIRLRPDSRRANELRGLSPTTVSHLWPRLEIVSCWADGHATGAARELAASLGSAEIQPKGLIATEGIISIPFRGRHPLAIRSHYLEFEDKPGSVLRASELREHQEYSVILTNGGGLCRYRLDDRVVVDGFVGRTPSIRFVGKSAQVSDRMGEKLSDGFVGAVLANLFEGAQNRPSFAMLAPDVDADGCRYTLYLSADASHEMCAKLELLLSENPHYRYCRRLSQLRPARLFRVSEDAAASYYQRLVGTGKRLGEIKPAGLSPLDGWADHLRGYYVDQRVPCTPDPK